MDEEEEEGQQEPVGQQPAQNTDNEATNCSETMSTNEEDFADMEPTRGEERTRQHVAANSYYRLAGSEPAQSGELLYSDMNQASDSPCYLAGQDDAETLTLSLASGAQAPPSYGTATRGAGFNICATLDAGQLDIVSSSMLRNVNHSQQQLVEHVERTSGHYDHLLMDADPTLLTKRKTIGVGAKMDQRLGQHFVNVESLREPTNNRSIMNGQMSYAEASYLGLSSGSGSLVRGQLLHGAHPNGLGNYLCQPKINLAPDNNHSNSNSLNWQQPQQQHRPLFGAPINHVISVGESALWRPQTNQCYTTTAAATSASPSTFTSAPAPPPVLVGPQPVQQPHPVQPSETLESAAIMDHHKNKHQPPSAFKSSQSMAAELGKQTDAANRFLRSHSNMEHKSLETSSRAHNQSQTLRRLLLTNLCRPPEAGQEATLERPRQQGQAHRKRRRHRSTSGPTVSPVSSELAAGVLPEAAWLGTNQSGSVAHLDPLGSPEPPPSDVSGRNRTRSGQRKAISAHCWLIDSSDDQTYVSGPKQAAQTKHLTVAMMRQTQQKQLTQCSSLNRTHSQRASSNYAHSDLTTDLKTNSLRMEQILTRSRHPQTPTGQSLGSTSHQGSNRRSRKTARSRLSFSASSSPSRLSSRVGQSQTNGQTLVRLSALLSLVSNLVKRAPKCLKLSSSSSQIICAPANSISGSFSAPSANQAPYTLGSLAISSSSSTSAYATGSSHLSSGSNVGSQIRQHTNERPMVLAQLKGTQMAPLSLGSVADSSMFYSSTGISGTQLALSSHSYEYCDDDRITTDETRFGAVLHEASAEEASRPHSTESLQTSSPPSLHHTSSAPNRLKPEPRHMAHMIMSDNELISAASDLNNVSSLNMISGNVFSSSVAAASVPSARQRWWWISFKEYLRRPCKTNSDSESGTDPPGTNQTEAAARYKSLSHSKARKTSRNLDDNRSSSTLENVISLAKADRVFRIRLMASIVVSLILLGLILLLAGLIYLRSNSLYQHNKLSLLIDDSDYDLSWLWPQTGQVRTKTTTPSSKSPYRVIDLQVKNPIDQMDNSLRTHLLVIERSERLNQFQEAISHLTNIQLANDNFIDLTHLAAHLAPSSKPINDTIRLDEFNRTEPDKRHPVKRRDLVQLTETDRDLISLTLLSNLHWPLVKWRHQNQQSVANFLSFAFAPSSSFVGGAQNLRNLLALLMLADSTPELSGASIDNLSQFARLNSLLRITSLHIVSCSIQKYPEQAPKTSFRLKFCAQLVARYKRMMLTLSHLNHSHLSKLDNPLDPNQMVGDGRQARWSRTLLGFFLDRLAIIDPEILAESTLATLTAEQDPDSLMDFKQTYIIEEILRQNIVFAPPGDDWQQKVSVHELAKSSIGEGPMKLNLNLNKNRDIQVRFQQLEAENTDSWRDRLAHDLLYPWTSFNLPQMVTPLNYDLFLHPNLTTKLIVGMVKIEFQLQRPTRYLVINCDRLILSDLTLWSKQSLVVDLNGTQTNFAPATSTLKQIPIRRVLINERLEQLYIELHNQIEPASRPGVGVDSNWKSSPGLNFGELPPTPDRGRQINSFLIHISFNKTSLIGDPETKESGLEFVQYGDYFAQPEAEVKTILYSQFEPFNARTIFPCLDEPQFKARFQMNLVHEHHHQVFFNAPKRERVPYTSDGSIQMSVFETTQVPLSTYLICFVICDAQNIKSITSRVGQLQLPAPRPEKEMKHIQVQILSQFEYVSQAEYASQLVPHLLAFYQNFLQFPYPMEKLDLIAIPKSLGYDRHYQIDTMENMGLIWFKAPLLLLDTNLISQNLIEQISMIVSHQVAHQYFGNIVTMHHWRDLWLYEALCQYFESLALSSVETDWKLEEQFAVTTIQDTLTLEQFEAPLEPVALRAELMAAEDHDGISRSWPDTLWSDTTHQSLSNDSSGQTELDFGQVDAAAAARATIRVRSLASSNELKRNSAILHMLLMNLFPSTDSKARLFRRCLNIYQYKTMSTNQFWHQFGQQLRMEASLDRLTIDLARFPIYMDESERHNAWLESPKNFSVDIAEQSQELPISNSERVVFVRPQTAHADKRNKESNEPTQNTRARLSGSLADNLDLVASAWSNRRAYPLITVTVYRDRIHLRQERFSFTKWNEPTLSDEQEAATQEPEGVAGAQALWTGIHRHGSDEESNRGRARRSSSMGELDDIWPIPLMFVSRYSPKSARFLWMTKRELELPLNEHQPVWSQNSEMHDYTPVDPRKGYTNSWIKMNVNQSSLVRVNYDERNWETLSELLIKSHYSNHILNSLDRANLIDDALTLMRCGKLSVGIAMNLTLYLEVGEREYMPWTNALRHLDQMQTLLNQNPLWHRHVLKLLQPMSSVIGWKDDGPHLMRKLRRNLFSVALQYGDDKTVNKAKQEFKSWFKNGRYIVPNLQELVYIAGVRYGDQQEWFHCWQKYQQLVAIDVPGFQSGFNQSDSGNDGGIRDRQTLLSGVLPPVVVANSESNEPNSENEKRQLLTALASTHNIWLLEQFLNYSLDSTKIQPRHLKHVLRTLGKNPVARLYLWRFVRLNWFTLTGKYLDEDESSATPGRRSGERVANAEYHQLLETMIIESTKHFASKLDYEEVNSFFESKRKQQQQSPDLVSWGPNLERAIQQSLQIIRSNIYWRDHIEPKLTKWLSLYDSLITNS